MKKALRKLGKLFLIVSYPILLVVLIIAIALFFIRTRELNSLNDTFAQAQTELNAENQDKQVTISDLRNEFQNLTKQVGDLKAENASLKNNVQDLQQTGYGVISGKVLPFVSGGSSDFSQYQLVCAELASNSNVQICRTVSAVEQNYTMGVLPGTYHVTAQIFPAPKSDSALYGFKGYYTAYVKCVHDQGADKCNQAQQNKPVDVTVKAGDTLTNIDPIDWQKK